MGSITRSHSFVSGEKPTESEWNVDIDQLFTLVNGQLDTSNVDTTSSDGVSVLNANQTITGTRTHSGTLTMSDDIDLIFGTNSDIKIQYDEGTDDALLIDTGVEGAALAVVLKADQGDDAGDAWKLNVADGGVVTLGNDIASKGTYVTQLTLTPNSTVASSTTAIAGHATVGGNLTVTGGVTVAGASAFDIGDSDKLLLGDSDDLQVYHDGSNSYIANATGALKLATETSGIAITIGHSTSETTVADNLTVTGTLGAGASTLASLVCTAAATFGGGTGSSGATITTGGAGTFDGILKTEDTTDATSTTDGSLQTDGGLSVAKDAVIGDDLKLLSDSSVLSLGAGSDATLTHDGTTGVTIAANPIIVDSGDALTLDAHTGIFIFKDAGSEVLRFTEGNSGDVTVKLATNGKDLVFTDNGDATNMKILDAAAGINVPGEIQTTKIAYTDGDDAITIADGGGVTTSSTLTIGTVAAAGEDTDKFLVLDSSGNVDYRTGSQVLSDIGAAGSGSATLAYKTISVSGQDNVVADATDDTLTLAAGSNITLTTNASSDTVTIAAASGGVDATNGVDDRIATFADSDTINGEANLTFSGSALTCVGTADFTDSNGNHVNVNANPASGQKGLVFGYDNSNNYGQINALHTGTEYRPIDIGANANVYLASSSGGVAIGTNSTSRTFEVNKSTLNAIVDFISPNTSQTADLFRINCHKSANQNYSFAKFYSGSGFGDSEFNFRGDGQGYSDGGWHTGNGDYAEYFESTDGTAIDVGTSVVMDGEKVRAYNASSDSTDSIVGVVRPKDDGKIAAVVGNTAWNHWTNKYLTDDWGVYLREDVTVWEWDEVRYADGDDVPEDKQVNDIKIEAGSCYERDELAKDASWTPPTGATSSNQNVRKLNPDYDASRTYTPREERTEWNLIGLLGQVQIKANEPVRPTWIKMKQISESVDLYLVR